MSERMSLKCTKCGADLTDDVWEHVVSDRGASDIYTTAFDCWKCEHEMLLHVSFDLELEDFHDDAERAKYDPPAPTPRPAHEEG